MENTYEIFEAEILQLISTAGDGIIIYIPKECHAFAEEMMQKHPELHLVFNKAYNCLKYKPASMSCCGSCVSYVSTGGNVGFCKAKQMAGTGRYDICDLYKEQH